MNTELLRQLSQRLLAPYGSQGHHRFESRRVVPAWSSAHRYSCSAAILAAVRQRLHLSNLFKNPEPALAAVVEDVWIGGEDPVRDPVLAHVLPDVLGRVQLRRLSRKRHEGDGGGDHKPLRLMPPRLVHEDEGMRPGCD